MLVDDVPDVAAVTRLVQRIQSALSEPRRLEGHGVVATTSVGIALSSTGYGRAEDMLRDADIALYRAKSLGKARLRSSMRGCTRRPCGRSGSRTS